MLHGKSLSIKKVLVVYLKTNLCFYLLSLEALIKPLVAASTAG